MKAKINTLFSMVLVLCLVLSSMSSSLALTNSTVEVDETDGHYALTDDIEVSTSGDWATGLIIEATKDHAVVDVDITGNITAEDPSGNAIAILVSPIHSTVNPKDDANIDIVVDGSLSADAAEEAIGVHLAYVQVENSSIDVDISGDVNVNTDSIIANGVRVYSWDGGLNNDISVNIDGHMQVTADEGSAYGIDVANEMSAGSFTMTVGDGIEVSTDNGTFVEYDDELNLDVENISQADGIWSESWGTPTEITVNGDIKVDGAGSATGIFAEVCDDHALINITVQDGDVIVNGGDETVVSYEKVYADNEDEAYNEDEEYIGYVESEESSKTFGVSICSDGGKAEISIDGDLTVTGPEDRTAAIQIVSDTTIEYTYAEADVAIGGDVTSSGDGIIASLTDIQTADIVIDGTLYAEDTAIVCMNQATLGDNLEVTVWKIETGENGSLVQSADPMNDTAADPGETSNYTLVDDPQAAKEIQYIIRLSQPEKGASVKTDGTQISHGYDVAHQDDYVYLKVTLDDGYEIVNAYNGTDNKVELLKDATSGEYYIVVPAGGGVWLSVDVRPITTTPATDSSSEAPAAQETTTTQEQTVEPDTDTAEVQAAAPAAIIAVAPVADVPQLNAAVIANSTETDNLIGALDDAILAGDLLSVFPASVQNLIPADQTQLKEVFTGQLTGVAVTDSYVWRFEGKASYAPGEVLKVVIALANEDGTFTYYVLDASVNEDGEVELVFNQSMILLLINNSFTTVVLGK